MISIQAMQYARAVLPGGRGVVARYGTVGGVGSLFWFSHSCAPFGRFVLFDYWGFDVKH